MSDGAGEPTSVFAPTSFKDWHLKVEKDLRGGDVERTLTYRELDGLGLRVLEHESTAPTAADPAGLPGVAPFTRGTRLPTRRSAAESWKVGLVVDRPDAEAARADLFHDLNLGIGSFWLRLRAGSGAGVDMGELAGFQGFLGEVDLSILELVLDAGDPLLGASLLAESAPDPRRLRGSLAGDPIGELARSGELDLGHAFDRLAAACRWCLEEAPGLRAGHLSGLTWHEAGATPAQELGLTLAAAVETLRRLEDRGVPVSSAASQLESIFAVGRETFLEIAKLRAWRLIFSKLLKASGAAEASAGQRLVIASAQIHLTGVDPWVNLLRATAQTFAAACAGADVIFTPRHDQVLHAGEPSSRRTSINLQHVLAQEAHLGRVVDPAGGSWAIERMTDALARQGWQIFREIEAEGGLIATLESGSIQSQIATAVEKRRIQVNKRQSPIIGVSFFPRIGEKRPEATGLSGSEATPPKAPSLEIEASIESTRALLKAGHGLDVIRRAQRASASRPSTVEPLVAFRAAEEFETLRLRVDDFVEAGAERPKILLAGLGEAADSRARREFAAGLFSVAGLEIVAENGFGVERPLEDLGPALDASGAQVVVLCSSDERYASLAAPAAQVLHRDGATRIYLAGRAGDKEQEWREAGVDEFIFLGCRVASILGALLDHLGIVEADITGVEEA